MQDDSTGFSFDRLSWPDGTSMTIKIRSIVGLIPIFGVTALTRDRVSHVSSQPLIANALAHMPLVK